MTSIAILFLIICIPIHELGHAFAMKKHKITIRQITLLGVGKILFSFRWRKLFGRTPLTVRLFPIGAYVEPTERGSEKIERLSLSAHGEIMGAGIAINFVLGSLFLVPSNYLLGYPLIVPFVFLTASVLILIFLKYSFYIFPMLGFVIVYLLFQPLFTNPKEFVQSQGSIVQAIEYVAKFNSAWGKVFQYGAAVSFSIGLFNCVPCQPLDGGKIMSKILECVFPSRREVVKKCFFLITILPIALLILLSVGSDIVRILNRMF